MMKNQNSDDSDEEEGRSVFQEHDYGNVKKAQK